MDENSAKALIASEPIVERILRIFDYVWDWLVFGWDRDHSIAFFLFLKLHTLPLL